MHYAAPSVNEMTDLNPICRCYGMGLKQVADCSSLWHDLGVNSFLQGQLREGPDAKALIAKATQCLQKAVTLDPANHRYWLALGLVAASDGKRAY